MRKAIKALQWKKSRAADGTCSPGEGLHVWEWKKIDPNKALQHSVSTVVNHADTFFWTVT